MSTSRVVPLAFPWPLGLALAGLGVWFLHAGPAQAADLFREGGLVALALVPVTLLAASTASALCGVGAPRATAVAAGLLPWLVGSLGAMWEMHKVTEAVAAVSGLDRGTMLAAGVAEVLVNRELGALLSAGALLGVAIAFAVRVGKDGFASLAAAGVAFAGFGLALGAVLEADTTTQLLRAAFMVAPAERPLLVAAGAARFAFVLPVTAVLAGTGAAVALVAGAIGRREIAGAVVAGLLLPIAPVVDGALMKAPTALAARSLRPPWAEAPGFQPVPVDGAPEGDVAVLVTDKDVLVNGKPAGPALGDALRTLAEEARDNRVAVAVDARTRPAALAAFVDGATAVGIETLDFTGTPSKPSSFAELARTPGVPPLVVTLMSPVPESSVPARLGCGDAPAASGVACRALAPDETPATLYTALAKAKHDGVVIALGTPPAPDDQALASAGEGGIASLLGTAGGIGGVIGGDVGGVVGARGKGVSWGTLGGRRPGLARGAPLVTGALDKEIIKRVVRRHVNEMRYCYERALAKNPSLTGKVQVTWTIAVDGSVSDAVIKSDDMHDAAVASCLVARVKRWTFPKPKGGVVVVTYPFVFKSE